MTRTPLLLLFLAACTTPLVQGLPTPPRPPAFSPVLDAPITTGQPGFVGSSKELPRGTDKRVLPPSREATIYASDGDETRAAARHNSSKPQGRPARTNITTKVSKECAQEIVTATTNTKLYEDPRAERARLEELRCLNLRLMMTCVDAELRALNDKGSAVRYLPRWTKNNTKKQSDVLHEVFEIECHDTPPSDDIQALYQLFRREFNRITGIPT